MGHVVLTLYNPSVDQKGHFHKKLNPQKSPGVDPPNPPPQLRMWESRPPQSSYVKILGGQPPQNPKFRTYAFIQPQK